MSSPTLSVIVLPNRSRGYDATVHTSGPAWLLAEMGSALYSVNAPSESAARALAQAWADAQPKPKRAPRAARSLAEGECESCEAARNERDYE
jgi:hypothetical protein